MSIDLRHEVPSEASDISRTHCQDEIPGAEARNDLPRHIIESVDVVRRDTRDGLGDVAATDTGVMGLPGCVYTGHDHQVGGGEFPGEVGAESARSRVEMRLEDDDHTPRGPLPGGRDGGPHLGGMVGVCLLYTSPSPRDED